MSSNAAGDRSLGVMDRYELSAATPSESPVVADHDQLTRARRPAWISVPVALLPHVVFLAAIVALWAFIADRLNNDLALVGPFSVLSSLYAWLKSGYILSEAGYTIEALFIAFFIGATLAFVLTVALAEFPRVGRFVQPYVIALDAIPYIALVPILIVWFGFGLKDKIIMGALSSFFVVFISSYQGIRNTDARYLELARILNANKLQTLVKVRLGYSIPFLLSAVKMALPKTAMAIVITEFLGSTAGLGYVIVRSENLLNMSHLFVSVLVLTIVVQAVSFLAILVERFALSWVPKEKR